MIPIQKEVTVLKTNAKFERQQFGIKDMSLVMDLLSKLYANPIQSLTQEYVSNARDANREVNSTKPIEITVPTRFSPTLKVRDYGLGISPKRIEDIFLFYCSSSKTNTNNQVGMFGIGSKSAFAYTDSFTIVTFIKGIKRAYIAHKSNGAGNLDLISEEPTKEANGTSIEIAIDQFDIDKFKNAVIRTIFFWQENEKPVIHGITKGELPENIPKYTFGNTKFYSELPFSGYTGHFLEVDGIPYPCPKSLLGYGSINESIEKYINVTCKVTSVKTGELQIAPNREEIVESDFNSEKLTKLLLGTLSKLQDYVEALVYPQISVKDWINLHKQFKTDFKFPKSHGDWTIAWNNNLRHNQWTKGIIINVMLRSDNSLMKTPFRDISITDLENLYYDDTGEHASKVNLRIRKLIQEGKKVLITKDKNTINDLQPVMLSTIPPLQKCKTVNFNNKPKAVREKGEIVLHKLRLEQTSYYTKEIKATPITRSLSEIKEQVIYMFMSDDRAKTENRMKYRDIFTYWSVYLIADGKKEIVKTHNKFIHLDEFLKNVKLSDSEKMQMKGNAAATINNQINFGTREVLINTTKDTFLSECLSLSNSSKVEMPNILIGKWNKSKEGIKFDKELSNLILRLQEYSFVLDNSNPSKHKMEIIEYINTKFKNSKNK
jgi:hypothetical protein